MVVKCSICNKGFNTKIKRDEHEEACKFLQTIRGEWLGDKEGGKTHIDITSEVMEEDGVFLATNTLYIINQYEYSIDSAPIKYLRDEMDKGNIKIIRSDTPFELHFNPKEIEIFTEVEVEKLIKVYPTISEMKQRIKDSLKDEWKKWAFSQRF